MLVNKDEKNLRHQECLPYYNFFFVKDTIAITYFLIF